MRRCSSKICSSPLVVVLALFLLVCSSSSFHLTAAARLLQPAAGPLRPLIAHQENGGVKAGAANESDGLVLQSSAGVSGDELSVSSEMIGAEAADQEACEEGNDECSERRLLGDAHLDYIYTQHRGKP